MPIGPGTRLGPYEVTALIGEGGMGKVWRAHHTGLKRDDALKVLPDAFASDPERLARFRREAQVLASLNHPNIAHVYGLEQSDGVQALVMELVEGPTLADRIAQGPIPVDEALLIAKQIAEAVEAAHEQGIIHRDLKPANIKLRSDGTVKVLDFGLAKALEPVSSANVNATASPTIRSPAMTGVGVLLGTAAYMSPEQARGLPVDRAADIWGWGCVLLEMLTGKPPFEGQNTTDVIAAVVRDQPGWAHLPAATPPGVRRLLLRCLDKDRRRRVADIRDARFAIEDAQDEPAVPPMVGALEGMHRHGWLAVVALVVLAAAAWGIWSSSSSDGGTAVEPAELRVEITTPPTTDLVSMAVSPDAGKIVYVGSSGGRSMLWLRSLVTGESHPLAGTDGATFPFWSPDSRSIGFFANERLYRIDVDGSSLRALAAAPVGAGGTWSRDGVILFTLVPDGPIFRVSDTGGETEALPGFDPNKGGNRFPQFLPDGRRYLYYMAEPDVRGIYLGTLDGSERRHLFDADAAAVFVPPAHILILRAGRLLAQRVDPVTLLSVGDAIPIASGVAVDSVGVAAVSSSSTGGAIAYRVGSVSGRQLLWVDRSGTQIGDAFPPDPESVSNLSLASDGRRLAVNRAVGGNTDIWIFDLERRGALTKLTSVPSPDISPVWSPEGNRIVYAGPAQLGFDLWQVSTTGPSEPVRLFGGPLPDVPLDWSKDGHYILYRTHLDPSTGVDLWAFPINDAQTPIPVARTRADEVFASFGPDGKWVVIESNETGRKEIYIQQFPGASARTPLSTGGGTQPRWRHDGREVFYVAPDGQLMSVELEFKDGAVSPRVPVRLFITGLSSTGDREYVVSADGKRFLMNRLIEQAGTPITLILNRANRSQ